VAPLLLKLFKSKYATVMVCNLVAPVFLQYEEELLGFLRKRLKDQDASEEVLKEVLMKVYKNCEKLPDVTNVRAWLFQVSRNAMLDYIRESKRYEPLEENAEIVEETENSLYQLMEQLLPQMIGFLPPKYATALEMSDMQGLPQKEVATRLKLSLSGAKSRIQRAREMLKEQFFECCHMELDARGVPINLEIKAHCTPLLGHPAFQEALPVQSNEKGCC
jgi:RNA polymerase sigma-70 factor (ECF subfamily)